MKKLLAASLSVALVYGLTGSVRAELLKNLKTDGEIEVHAVETNNLTDASSTLNDKDSRAHTRVILNAAFDLNEDASAMVTIGKTSLNRTYGTAPQSATTVEGEILFDQAYINLKNIFGFDHKLGRQFYGTPGDLVVYYGPSRGPVVLTLPITGVDAYTGWFTFGEGGNMHGNVIVAKLADNSPDKIADIDLRGVEVSYSQLESMTPSVQVYDRWQKAFGGKGHTYTLSPKVVGKTMDGNLAYRAQLAINAGYNPGVSCTGDCKASGTAILAGADYSMPFMGKLKIMGEFGLGSGDDNAGDTKSTVIALPASDYRPGDIAGGNAGLVTALGTLNPGLAGVGTSGLTTINVGFWHDTENWPKLGWGLHFYDFSASKKNASPTGKAHMASELDLRAKWTHSDKLAISAGYGMLTPDISGSDNITQTYLNLHLTF